jgi:hypothetical protein
MVFGTELFFYLFFAHLLIAILSVSVAGEKGYSENTWFFLSLFTGLLGLIAIAGMPDLKQRKYLRLLAEKAGLEPGD